MKISQIEEILVKKEIEALNAEITKGYKIIFEAFKKYNLTRETGSTYYSRDYPCTVNVTKEDMAQFEEYINKIKIAGSFYYGGDWFTSANPEINPDNPPEFIKKILAQYAAANFIKQVEAVEEISNQVQQLEHNQNAQ